MVESLPAKEGFAQCTPGRVGQTSYIDLEVGGSKWRSPLITADIMADISCYHNETPRPRDILLDYAILKTREDFRLPTKVKMLHLNDVFSLDLDIWDKSPGLPWCKIGYKMKGDIRKDPDAVQGVRRFWHYVKGGNHIQLPDCMAFARSHMCQCGERKVRAIWGYPATLTFGEAVFAKPLIEEPIKIWLSMTAPLHMVLRSQLEACGNSFDKTVPAWMIDLAFDILLENIDLVNYQDHGVADGRRMLLMYYYLKQYFINTIIRTSTGSRFQKFSGVASGSYFTQLVGSVCNGIIVNWLSLSFDGAFPLEKLYMGDDSLVANHSLWSLDQCQRLVRRLGMSINMSKSQSQHDLHSIKFLGYTINHGISTKPFDDWMTALCFPEYPDRDFDVVQSRALGLCYANMGIDEKFHAITSAIVRFKPFTIAISKNLARIDQK
ncbi:hypothetical protein ANN_00276 [Periplaneta americana]|uniref:RNA-directed RNA polymerase C-terminal domain-containing protein n=1 Tax=Periplaneta americana TaxID=6978 RepID=A0ABQ8TQE2_PERAM|nr:hypothetical protein ANN_00276 [Periplaneta americana]